MTTFDNSVDLNSNDDVETELLKDDQLSMKVAIDTVIEYNKHSHSSADNGGTSTDENVVDVLHDSEEDLFETQPDAKQHYDNLSDSHLSSPIDDEEEEKMEQEITNRLSHLTIDRDIHHYHLPSPSHDFHFRSSPKHKEQELLHWNDEWKQQERIHSNKDLLHIEDIDDDPDEIHVTVADEHYQSMYIVHHEQHSKHYAFSLHSEFLSNETFLKYVMLYGTIYFVSRFTLNRYATQHVLTADGGIPLQGTVSCISTLDTHNISRKIMLVSNAVIAMYKGQEIWNTPYKAIISPFRQILSENELYFMDIQKAFYFVMIVISYFGGKQLTKNERIAKRLSRLYDLVSLGCIVLIKKYKKCGGLYMYTQFWMQLSSFFMHSSQILKSLSIACVSRWSGKMRGLSRSSMIIHALIMIYSRLYLFTKIMIPIIQNYYRNNNQYIGSVASIGYLISGYYKTGDQFIKTFLEK